MFTDGTVASAPAGPSGANASSAAMRVSETLNGNRLRDAESVSTTNGASEIKLRHMCRSTDISM